jgi:hypothetical protein
MCQLVCRYTSARADAVKHLRYHLFVDSMPTEDIPPLTVGGCTR